MSKFVFFPLQGVTLSNPQKNSFNGKDINRLTEQKTGADVNKNKLVTKKKRGWTEERQGEEKGKRQRPGETEREIKSRQKLHQHL